MAGPGQYVAEVTEGITRVEDLPKPKMVRRSRNYRHRGHRRREVDLSGLQAVGEAARCPRAGRRGVDQRAAPVRGLGSGLVHPPDRGEGATAGDDGSALACEPPPASAGEVELDDDAICDSGPSREYEQPAGDESVPPCVTGPGQ